MTSLQACMDVFADDSIDRALILGYTTGAASIRIPPDAPLDILARSLGRRVRLHDAT